LTIATPSLAVRIARCQNSGQMHRGIANREEAAMSRATIAPPEIKTLADLRRRLGGIPLARIWFHPAPGTAAEKDVVEAEERENRLCELVDGTLVEKAPGFKVREYFEAGVVLVWLIDPRKRTARVYSTVEKSVLVRADQTLDGGGVLPGFVIRLSDLLDRGRRPRRGRLPRSRDRFVEYHTTGSIFQP
jgi:hypothetical protein